MIEDISASTISVWTDLSATTIYANDITGTNVTANTLYANVFEPLSISTDYILANRISVTDISAVNLDAQNLYVSGIIAPTVTAETLNAGIILATGSSLPIGTLVNESAIIITDDRTTIQNVDLSGTVYIGQGSGYGQLVLDSFGTEDNPSATIYPNTYDSSGQLNLGANHDSTGIILRPGETQISNPRVVSSSLLIDNGTIGKTGSNPNAIVIGTNRTMIQNADLSGLVYIGQGTDYGRLVLNVQGTADFPISSIYSIAYDSSGVLNLGANSSSTGIILRPAATEINNARIVTGGLLIDNGTIGKSGSNPKAIVIGDTQTIIQNADLSGTVYIGNGDISGALQIQSGAEGQATIRVNTAASGEILIGSSDANQNAIRITDTATTLKNVSFLGGLLLGDNGTIGSSALNPNAIVITDTSGTIIQNPDLSGTVYIGHGNLLNSLKITGGDVSGTIQSFNTIRPTVAISGEILIGSSDANQNAIRITDTATTLKNVSFLGGLLLGNGGTIGSSTLNPNAIVVSDTSGTIFQNRGDSSGTISIGNPGIGALQLTGSSSGSTIRPTVASAGRLSIGSSTANPNTIVISDTSGTIIQNRGDLSGTLFVGNPSRGLRITGGDVSGVAIPTGFATMRPSVSVSGCLVLGSSTANPDAITITDTTTSIKNLSFSGGLLIGNGGTIGSTQANPSAITITDSLTTITNPSLGTPTITNIVTVGNTGDGGTGNMLIGGNGGSSLSIQGGNGAFINPRIRTSATPSNGILELGSDASNLTAIIITYSKTTITNLTSSTAVINLNSLLNGQIKQVNTSGQYYFQASSTGVSPPGPITPILYCAGPGRYSCTCTSVPATYSAYLTIRVAQNAYPGYADITTSNLTPTSNYLLYSFDVISIPPANNFYLINLSSNILTL